MLETAVQGCSVARRRGIVEESTLEERRRGGRERVAGAGLMRVIEVWDNREATWRRGVVANIREEAGRFRHWLVWAGATAPEEVDLQTVQWRWADAAQPVARERSGGGAFRRPRRWRSEGSGLQEVWTAGACGTAS